MRINFPRSAEWQRDWRLAVATFVFVLGVDLVVAMAYSRLGFWVVIGVLVAAATTVSLFSSAQALILTVFLAKPFVDMLWFASAGGGGVTLNAQSVLSVVILFASMMFLVVRRVEVDKGLLAPMTAVVLSNLWALALTPNVPYAAEYLIRIVCGFPLVFVVPAVIERLPPARSLLRWFYVIIGVVCVTVVLQPIGLLPYTSFEDSGVGRATGFYYHPWDVARYMVIVIPLLLAALDEPGRHRFAGKWPYWALLALVLATTYSTFLKAAWIAVLFQILLWLFLTGRGRLAFVILAATVALVAFPLRQGFTSVFSDLWKLGESSTRGQALSGRVFVWSEYWKGLRGSGLGNIMLGQGFLPSAMGVTNRATHDDYLRLLVMNGVTGVLVYVWLMIAALRSLSRAIGQLAKRKGTEWRVGIAVGCLVAAYLLMGITADPSSYPSLTIYMWLLIGLVLGYAKLDRKIEDDEPPKEFAPKTGAPWTS